MSKARICIDDGSTNLKLPGWMAQKSGPISAPNSFMPKCSVNFGNEKT
ncbi:plasmid segregation protein ParM [Rouxiella badensis]|nr:plasmid segregation protein ParM [Rouxiella badensis]MCC3731299.1 plasmid segregation protein ParM [Rouxiella badensis]MCC3742877.1 plasmid segregation protein ParM [Rouxiella badensis]